MHQLEPAEADAAAGDADSEAWAMVGAAIPIASITVASANKRKRITWFPSFLAISPRARNHPWQSRQTGQ